MAKIHSEFCFHCIRWEGQVDAIRTEPGMNISIKFEEKAPFRPGNARTLAEYHLLETMRKITFYKKRQLITDELTKRRRMYVLR